MLVFLLVLPPAIATTQGFYSAQKETIGITETITVTPSAHNVSAEPTTHIDIPTNTNDIPVASSASLASYGWGPSSLDLGPESTMTWCATSAAGSRSGPPASFCIPSTASLSAITLSPFSVSYASTPRTTASRSPLITESSSTTYPMPTGDVDPVEKCLVVQQGGLQPDGQIAVGCGAILQHITDCYQSLAPWQDPYNTSQSTVFQACMCQTSSNTPFTPESILSRNFTGCSNCLLGAEHIVFSNLSTELQRIENFCCSQNPVAYLFLLRLLGWLHSLQPGSLSARPPLIGGITLIGKLGALYSTNPPLANLAYGPSAPPDGNWRGVTPSMTTYTTTAVKTSGSLASTATMTITSVATWLHTATSESVTSFDSASASQSAAGVASVELQSALNSMASEMVVAVPSQGGPAPVCIGKSVRCSGVGKARVNLKWLALLWLAVTAVMHL